MIRTATFNEEHTHRYRLLRKWSDGPMAMCIGLNPSRADSEKDDPTIRRLISDLTQLGYGGFYMCNLYAYITPDPKALSDCANPLIDNDKFIALCAEEVKDVIFCWGHFKGIEYRAKQMMKMFPGALCFGKSSKGTPLHPLALMYAGVPKADVKLIRFR